MNHETPPFLPPTKLVEKLTGMITFGQLQWWLYNRDDNGLAPYVHDMGRGLLIDVEGFIEWIKQQPDSRKKRSRKRWGGRDNARKRT